MTDKPADYCRFSWWGRNKLIKRDKPQHFFMYHDHWYCVEYGGLGKRVYHSLKWWYYFTGERITP